MGIFVITQRKDGEFQFNLNAANGLTILTSQGYAKKAGCENGIASVRVNSADESMFELMTSASGQPYFNLKASNGQVIGVSQMYESKATRDNGIVSVMTNAPDASVTDETV